MPAGKATQNDLRTSHACAASLRCSEILTTAQARWITRRGRWWPDVAAMVTESCEGPLECIAGHCEGWDVSHIDAKCSCDARLQHTRLA